MAGVVHQVVLVRARLRWATVHRLDFRYLTLTSVCCRASLRHLDATGGVIAVVDGASVAFSALSLGDAIVLLGHHTGRSIDDSN